MFRCLDMGCKRQKAIKADTEVFESEYLEKWSCHY